MAVSQATAEELRHLIHHSDRGVQYCCNAYTDELKRYGVSISMTEDYKPTDNAIAERVNGILKTEVIYRERRFKSLEDTRERIGKKREYISSLEQGQTDMQLSTFMLISNALGLRFSLVVG